MNAESRTPSGGRGDIVIYQAQDGTVELDVRLTRESLWLSQKQMALLFEKDTDTIGLHLRNVFKEGELEETTTTEEYSVVQTEGQRQVSRKVRFYNLDAILSVGYRVNSKRARSSASGPRVCYVSTCCRAIRSMSGVCKS